MSGFWSVWVIVLAVLTLGISLFLFLWGLRVRIPTQPDGTTGHNWDGIREGLHALPRWWIAISIATFAAGLGYLVLYPGLGNFKGTLGWSSEGRHAQQTEANDTKLAARVKPWRSITLEQMSADKEAVHIGGRLFQDNCAACHGSQARGNHALGAPDLTDAVWEYGGSGSAILASILDGRSGTMPPWGAALTEDGVNEVAAYLQSLSGESNRAFLIRPGENRYATFCVSCHGDGGVGRKGLGPNLADHAWLYGDNWNDITASIRDGRTGVMPAWRPRLSEDQARLVTAWVLWRASRGRTADP
jgi:cytochrome c oxidase cbb3-type subunit 3